METLLIPDQIIEQETTKLVNKFDSRIFHSVKTDSIGKNSIYEASPSVLTFAGYEIKKSQSLKLTIKNISSQPQRLSILPTTTPFFKPHYNKKGQLAPGMCETIILSFTPSEWRYYYDCLRILTAAGNINIPVHAYPIMNSSLRYLPSTLDLGRCFVGQQLRKTIELRSTVPVSFEYEIRVTDPNPDILVGPVIGEVPGNGTTSLEVVFNPHAAATASCEFSFLLSEFDFKPITTRVIASATHASPSKAESTKNLLTSKDTLNSKKKLPEIARFAKTVTKVAAAIALAPKQVDRVIYEQQFNMEYRKLEEYDREKEFKIYTSLGNPHPTEEFINGVFKERSEKEENRLREVRKKDLFRSVHESDKDKSVVMVEFVPGVKPSWNAYQNDEFSLRQLPLNRFVRAANTVMTRLRADKRIAKIKETLQKYSVKTRAEAKEFVALDWKQADLIGVGKQDFIPFAFSFPDASLHQQMFPEQFTDTLDEFKKSLEISPLSNFDAYYAMSLIEAQDFMLAGYPDVFPVPASHYVPIEKERDFRAGAEEEYAICQEKGEFREDALPSLPSNALKPLALDPVSVVRPHPSLRCYLTLNAVSETSPEHLLTPVEVYRNAYDEYPGNFVPTGYMLCNKWRPKGVYAAVSVPEKRKGANSADALSESDSDNENTAGLEVPALETYMAVFEADDEVVRLSGRGNAKAEAVAAICEEIEKNKQRDIAWIPAQITAVNKVISEPEFKLSIL
jgi:hypothetical protein